MNEASTRKYWFGPKTYGWGWGLPLTWQGWVVLVAYLAFMICLPILYPPTTDILPYLGAVALASTVLILICWRTGVPPKWRWGDE
jgi:hypothetical protein